MENQEWSDLRRRLRLTQTEFAALVGYSRAYVARAESGKAQYKWNHIKHLESQTGLTVHTLLRITSDSPQWLESYLQLNCEDRRRLSVIIHAALQIL